MRRPRRENCVRGFTLTELLMVVAISATVVVTFLGVQDYLAVASDRLFEQSNAHNAALTTLREIEQAIRLADEIEAAAPSLLTLKTRFLWDLDTDWEKVRYTLRDGGLYREIADDNSSVYSAPVLVLDSAVGFDVRSMELAETFSSADYLDLTGVPLSPTPDFVGYLSSYDSLTELSSIDSVLSSGVDTALERLSLTSTLVPVTASLTPELESQGLWIRTEFTPLVGGAVYYPLIFGSSDPSTNAIAIRFDSDGSIDVECFQGSILRGATSFAETWVTDQVYHLEMTILHGVATARVICDGTLSQAAPIADGVPSSGVVRFRVDSLLASGAWDDLRVSYPFVEVELSFEAGGVQRTLFGGATRRQP
ncbi:MAG: type II secretion system protein [Planctomycetes bacterium]|nr:type II secretion system protein [Planctomycetota bacterium]